MTGLADDHDSAIKLIIEEYTRLQKHNPKHGLLKYIIPNEDKRGFDLSPDEKIREEFLDKYFPKEKMPWVVVLSKYYVDLRNAVDKIEGIDRSPRKPEPVSSPSSLDDDLEDLPF